MKHTYKISGKNIGEEKWHEYYSRHLLPSLINFIIYKIKYEIVFIDHIYTPKKG